MKFKKIVSALLVAAMSVSLVACGNSGNSGNNNGGTTEKGSGSEASGDGESGDELVIWAITNDQITQAAKWEEETGNKAEVTVIAPADYPTKIQAAMTGGEGPDIIMGEPQMLQDFYDAGYFEDLNQDPYNAQDYADQIVDYVWEVGQDSEGIQRAISYQITPAGIYYRRDIAQEVFGTDDPEEIGKLFADYSTILDTAQKLKEAGYRCFASDGEITYFSGDSAWVIDGELNVDQARYDYMDLCIALYQQDLTAYASQWSTPWYQAMAGAIPILTADDNVWSEDISEETADRDTVEVFAYGLPSWGVLTFKDNVGDNAGKWGVCSGPAYGFGGGTYLGISSQSDKKDLAWEFVKWMTLNEETADWWIEESEGDCVSLISALEKHADDENEIYGGQKLYSFWLEQAEGIDYSKVTRYDTQIGNAWGEAISKIKTGELTKEEAIANFYDTVEATYPGEITVNRD